MSMMVNTRHLRQVVSMLDTVKDEVRAVDVTGATVTVLLSTDAAAKRLGDFLHLEDTEESPYSYAGASGDNYWYVLAPEHVTA